MQPPGVGSASRSRQELAQSVFCPSSCVGTWHREPSRPLRTGTCPQWLRLRQEAWVAVRAPVVRCGCRHVVLLWVRASPASCLRWPALGAPGGRVHREPVGAQQRAAAVTSSALLSGRCGSCRWKGPCGAGETPTVVDPTVQRQGCPQGALSPISSHRCWGQAAHLPMRSTSPRSLGRQGAADGRRAESSGPGRSGLLHCVTRGALAMVTFKVVTSFK